MAMPRASLLQTSSYRRKPVSRLSDACHRSRWIPAYAGMTMQWIRTGSAFSATFLASPRAGQKRIRASTCLSLATRGELRSPRFWTSTAGTRPAFGAERHSGSGALGGLRPGLRPQLAPAKVARPSKGRNQSERHWTPAFAGVTKIESSVQSLCRPPKAGKGLRRISRKHSVQQCAYAGMTVLYEFRPHTNRYAVLEHSN